MFYSNCNRRYLAIVSTLVCVARARPIFSLHNEVGKLRRRLALADHTIIYSENILGPMRKKEWIEKNYKINYDGETFVWKKENMEKTAFGIPSRLSENGEVNQHSGWENENGQHIVDCLNNDIEKYREFEAAWFNEQNGLWSVDTSVVTLEPNKAKDFKDDWGETIKELGGDDKNNDYWGNDKRINWGEFSEMQAGELDVVEYNKENQTITVEVFDDEFTRGDLLDEENFELSIDAALDASVKRYNDGIYDFQWSADKKSLELPLQTIKIHAELEDEQIESLNAEEGFIYHPETSTITGNVEEAETFLTDKLKLIGSEGENPNDFNIENNADHEEILKTVKEVVAPYTDDYIGEHEWNFMTNHDGNGTDDAFFSVFGDLCWT